MKINYNGGHKSPNNEFKAIYGCGSPSQADLEDNGPKRQAFQMNYNAATAQWEGQCEVEQCPAPDAAEIAAGTYCPADDGNDEPGYIITCQVPQAMNGECTMALVDQRDWGGCYDLVVSDAPTEPP